MLKNLRRVSQGIFLILFLFLFIQTESKGADDLGYPVKVFLDFDPLILITNFLSSHAVVGAFYFSIFTIFLTIVMGRVFCGWICPLGTLNNMVGSIKTKRRYSVPLNWRQFKYFILIFLIASSAFTLQLSGIFDPLSLLIRSFSTGVYPAFNYGLRAFFDSVYELHLNGISEISEPVYSFLRKTILSFQQPFYSQATIIGLILIFILLMNLVQKRFWCKNLCPLGALLGLFARFSFFRRFVSEGCTSCSLCDSVCQGGASPDRTEEWLYSECLYCMDCDGICPGNAVSFGFARKKEGSRMDLGRRQVFISLLSGIAAVPLLRQTSVAKSGYTNALLIRPPGALDEREFLKRCVKCGECMKVCITNGLQPTFLEAGLEGIWSPMLVPRSGYCEFRCTLCGQVCPTGAIKRLDLNEKAKTKIGIAMIDKGRCLPHTHATPCIVCEEVCPTPKKAIWLDEVRVKDRKGKEITVQQPRVDLQLCIGCGICEAKCPVASRPAIYVTSVGESRSKTNQLLMPY